MKLVRYGPAGKEKPGLIDADGKLRDLSRKVKDIDRRDARAGDARGARASSTRSKLPLVKGKPRLGACVAGAVASSSRSASTSSTTRRRPARRSPSTRSCSSSRPTCIVGPERQRHAAEGLDAARLGGRARRRDRPHRALRRREGRAASYVAGYCLINDVSEREFQMKSGGGQWSKGKGCDTFGPLGPWLVTTRRDQGPAEPRHVARRQRRAQADRQHAAR